MNIAHRLWLSFGLTLLVSSVRAQTFLDSNHASQTTNVVADTNAFLGWSTNGAAIFRSYRAAQSGGGPALTNHPNLTTNFGAPNLRAANPAAPILVFAGFRPESLNQLIWTNFVAHTNGRNMYVWSKRTHPLGWPIVAPLVTWNTNSLMWGMQGITALSPCWEGEGNSGQVPITLLTRRHGYTRGHGMGPEGFSTRRLGSKVWFLAADNSLVTVTIRREVVRFGKQGDYTIFLFDRDLPDTIRPIRVTTPGEVQGRYLSAARGAGNTPIFKTEQGGNVSAEVPGFTINTWKGGDSGSPNLLPLPGELVFFSGRSTSGPTAAMQADMDELTRLEGLSPAAYQLQWVDLSKYPAY